ncbi:UDP-arabinose 4-epimerase 1 [Vigna radiata var. radiata]|uniref:UDP-arabinose 4-epimerase 1 n=1 Tax=Vigna radiata var. radiata TaxID=3916 RepID=A0A1S3VLY3_VIGRR|nr:UDP-arabinose 4-epimerase 1 [Vigna radiata var. radiata]
MLNFSRTRSQPRSTRSMSLGGMDYVDPKRKSNYVGKIFLAAALTALCIIMIKRSPSLNPPSPFSIHEPGVTHVLVTGGAGYIGSHATLRLLRDFYRVTIVDNLSRGNLGAVRVLQELFPEPGRLQFIYADLGDKESVNKIFSENKFDAVMHFAAVAYVGESTLDPLKYYHNITSNTLLVLESMAKYGVNKLIYSSTCATYGEPEKMPITEETEQKPINPYGKAKKMSEDIILDFSKTSKMAVMILRYFNVIGSDPEGRLGEAPRPELREHGRISGACFDAARGITTGLKVRGTDYKTPDGTCIRDYIDVTDLVDAHVKALEKAQPGKVGIYNVGTGKGRSVKEFVDACKKATGVNIKVDFLPRRPGDYAEVYSDPSKINLELNWTAQYTDLEKSLQTAWKWQKSHRNGYGISSAI